MSHPPLIRETLRSWITERSRKDLISPLLDDTPLIEQGILSSVQVMDVILLIERMRNRPVDVGELKPGSFRDINSIVSTFFQGSSPA